MGLVAQMNNPPYLSTERATFRELDRTVNPSAWVDFATNVTVFIVQDSPEARQYSIGFMPNDVFQDVKSGHFDYIMIHDAYLPANANPTVRKLKRDDRVLREKNGELLRVVFNYDFDPLVQLLYLVKQPADEKPPTRVT